MTKHTETAVFGGGCFWCTEAVFTKLKGVISVTSGYAGGKAETAQYESVSTGMTDHAEVVRVEFDPLKIQYTQLLGVFFSMHDPTTLNKQGADVGSQYRSIIFTTSDEQYQQASDKVSTLQTSLGLEKRVVTQISPLTNFYDAESYHQQYFDKNPAAPYCSLVIAPKLDKVLAQFPELVATRDSTK